MLTHAQRLYLLYCARATGLAQEKAQAEGETFHPFTIFTPLDAAIEGHATYQGGVLTLTLRSPSTDACDDRIEGIFQAFFDQGFTRDEPEIRGPWRVHRGHATNVADPFATEPSSHDPDPSSDRSVRHPR